MYTVDSEAHYRGAILYGPHPNYKPRPRRAVYQNMDEPQSARNCTILTHTHALGIFGVSGWSINNKFERSGGDSHAGGPADSGCHASVETDHHTYFPQYLST